MRINEAYFKELYPQMVEYMDIFYTDYTSDKQFTEEYLPSKLWRLNNLYTIIDKDGDRIPFVMNKSQHRVYAAVLEHPRLIILKSRQQGISTFWLIFFLDDAIFENDFNLGLMAQGKEEAETLLLRVKTAWGALENSIKEFLQVNLDKDNSSTFSFSNGSTLFIRTSFRSATLQRLHISELGKIANKYPKRAKETNSGTLQAIKAGNIAVIESTAEGNNMFSEKWDAAILADQGELGGKDFKPVFLSWLDDPDCVADVMQHITKEQAEYFEKLELELCITISPEQKWFWVMQYRELQDGDTNDIYQEYPSTPEEAFTATRNGAYYASLYLKLVISRNREVTQLLDTNLDVDIVIDLGMNDDFVVGFWQNHRGAERLVHDYNNSGEGIAHYVNYINNWCKKTGARIGTVTLPHDAKVKELGTGVSRKRRFQELGVRRIRVLPKAAINDGIEAVRRMLQYLYVDPEMCAYTIKGFKNYSKEWDDVRRTWKDKPLHNEWSHPMDMVRYRAMSRKEYYTMVDGTAPEPDEKESEVYDGMAF